jgi:vacuolar-type H+-ATPase subunit D/Vma8
LRQENERLGSLLDNHDDMLREAKKMRKELRASLKDARTRAAELETRVLDSKLEIDSLKASPVVSNEVDCAYCSIFVADLALFKEKHASKCEELDEPVLVSGLEVWCSAAFSGRKVVFWFLGPVAIQWLRGLGQLG